MIGVTGATGKLGRLAIDFLLEQGIAGNDVVAVVRTPAKAAELAAKGVQVRQASYDDPAALTAALAGIDRLLFISDSEVGKREAQHGNVVDAAGAAGVGLIAYTSIVNADTTPLVLADEHKSTERRIVASGIPYVLLRNGWYLEIYTEQLASYLEHGVINGSSGEGRISAASRIDYAQAAATVVGEAGHENHIYELGGAGFTMGEFADALSRISGKPVRYRNLSTEEHREFLVSVWLPEPYAAILADADAGAARGALFTDSGDLERLLGRAPTPYETVLQDALQ